MNMLVRLSAVVLFAACVSAQADPHTFTVTNTNDNGAGSLRQAIIDANGASGSCDLQTIVFAIPGSGVHTIRPNATLPTIQMQILIDGYSQPGSAQNSLSEGDNAVILIELDGSNAGASNGFTIGSLTTTTVCSGSGTRIRGLAINRFALAGIEVTQTGCTPLQCFPVGSLRISGNFIGTDPTGKIARANNVGLHFGLNSDNNIVGDELLSLGGGNPTPNPSLRNIISGNTTDGIYLNSSDITNSPSTAHHFRGNYIGVDATGAKALPNGRYGLFADAGSTNEALHDSIVGGHSTDGVRIVGGAEITFRADAIGIGIGGVALPNAGHGIHIMGDAQGVGVSDTYPALSNAGFPSIANNGGAGLYVEGDLSTVDVVRGSFSNNGGLGIDLAPLGVNPNDATNPGTGPNQLLNAPVLLTATYDGATSPPATVTGEIDTTPNSSNEIHLYVSKTCDPSGFGEGEGDYTFANATADSSGHATFSFTGYFPSGMAVTAMNRRFATGTDVPAIVASEFSNCIIVGDPIFADGFDS